MRFAHNQTKIIPDKLLPSPVTTFPISSIDCTPSQPFNPDFSYDQELLQLLTGKQLLLDELNMPLSVIQTHYENGYLLYRKGIVFSKNKTSCVRCGNQDKRFFAHYPCSKCGETCLYCRKCIMMGRVSACTPLISWNAQDEATERNLKPNSGSNLDQTPDLYSEDSRNFNPNSHPNHSQNCTPDSYPKRSQNPTPDAHPNQPQNSNLDSHPEFPQNLNPDFNPLTVELHREENTRKKSFLSWSGTLSEGQIIASKRVVEAINRNDEILIWAVCGAGKTEVLFNGIDAALQAGKRVCLATPRTDVVLELTPRLAKVFPTIEIASLYGGTKDRHLYAPLTIATTHQLLRFYQAFETIILDEVDAFPYSVDASLQYAVHQARKQISSIVYLTATPNKKWQADCRSGKRKSITIPARFHRHPLPVPQFRWCGNWEKALKKGKLPPIFLQWIKRRLATEKQCLLFVPKIEKMQKILPIIRRLHPLIEAVHAEDPRRKEKVQAMRNKEIPLLLTTTILERGVTFPNIDVAILGAEDQIFTDSALVQIAGRVGRSADAPRGEIIFFHYGKTEAMLLARKQIINMNAEARKKGLLDM